MTALQLCYVSAGLFFMIGLLSGIWKYAGIIQSNDATAPEYVSVLHRAALLYSFATLLLAQFVQLNPYSETVKLWAVIAVVAFFVFAQSTYLIHALLKDTDNQFRKPYRLGGMQLPPFIIHTAMILLIVAEIGGFLVLFWGYLQTLL
ncbi:MAG: hypothetical protein KDK30_17960 [Leptospiraceae bacterium]|nr:hypothetical protein [Leptospiraceae bacterium]